MRLQHQSVLEAQQEVSKSPSGLGAPLDHRPQSDEL